MNKLSDAKGSTKTTTVDQLMTALFDATYTVDRLIEEALDKVGLSWAKLDLLTKLARARETLPLSELASQMTCVRSNITQLVDRLEAEGLVRREEDPNDRRAVRAALTSLGRERQAAGEQRLGKLKEQVFGVLSKLDREALYRALSALRALADRK